MNESDRSPGDLLDARIDRALRRLFAPPPALDALVERARARLPRTDGRPGRAPLRRALFIGSAAAAALALLGLGAARLLGKSEPDSTPTLAVAALPPVGPLEECAGEPDAVRAPDLAALYRTMEAWQRSPAPPPAACNAGDRLAESLTRSYGERIELRPEAAWMLHGPFSSPEWPTGTILTGFPEERTAVLVAERDSTLACCLRMTLPEDSGLRMFTWQVGNVVLTEITPLDEPRLIECFQ